MRDTKSYWTEKTGDTEHEKEATKEKEMISLETICNGNRKENNSHEYVSKDSSLNFTNTGNSNSGILGHDKRVKYTTYGIKL